LNWRSDEFNEAFWLNKSFEKPIDLSEAKTTDISSDEFDVFERKKNFDELSKWFEKHRNYALWNTWTNDYKYHIYLRKMKKLAMNWYGSIDIGGYTEYI